MDIETYRLNQPRGKFSGKNDTKLANSTNILVDNNEIAWVALQRTLRK